MYGGISVTRMGDLLHFGQLCKACGNIFLPKLPTFLVIFGKVSKSFIFLLKSFLGNFCRHLATFYWSHWVPLVIAKCEAKLLMSNESTTQATIDKNTFLR